MAMSRSSHDGNLDPGPNIGSPPDFFNQLAPYGNAGPETPAHAARHGIVINILSPGRT
jgi:hypothetical protein